MKIFNALSKARAILFDVSIDTFKLDALILLCHTLSCSKEQVIFNPDLELSLSQEEDYFALINRRKNFEPVSHIIGKREFFGEDFHISADVLDPRPDSESLIELVLKNFPNHSQDLKILELGVGSGCLIITLLNNYKNSFGIGIDVSEKALNIAKQNSLKLQVNDRFRFLQSNLFSSLNSKEKFDIIISNPPYIPSKDIEVLQEEVKKFEPRLALDGGEDGLDFYRKIAAEAKKFLKEEGRVLLEIGFGQKNDIVEIFDECGFILDSLNHDLSKVERALSFKIK